MVRVPPEKRGVRPRLHPSNHKLFVRVPEEASHVRSSKAQPRDVDGEQHGSGDLQVVPSGRVVPRPYRAPPLGACVERTGEDEGAVFSSTPKGQSLGRRALEEHSVDIVPVPVLDALEVCGGLLHGNLGAVEDGHLVHVVPDEEGRSAPDVLVELELGVWVGGGEGGVGG